VVKFAVAKLKASTWKSSSQHYGVLLGPKNGSVLSRPLTDHASCDQS